MRAIFKRELKSYFYSPLGYVFLALIFFFGGQFFSDVIRNSSTKIDYVFGRLIQIVIVFVPLITMRLMSEDKKLKTDQLLLTAPVKISGIVLGKYFAALAMYLIGICSTIVYVIILSTFTTPDWNIFFGNFLALALLGGAILAIGLFISSLTENQMVAGIVSFGIMMVILLFDAISASVPIKFISDILKHLSFTSRYQDLISGILNVSHVIFFISVIVVFNFLTVRVLERKRWS